MRTFTYLLYFICGMKLSTVYALSCEICNSPRLQICHSSIIPCSDASQVCINIAINVSTDILPLSSMLRRMCGIPSQCDLEGTLTSVNTKYRFATACCNTSACTPAIPTYLPFTDKKNGRLCPARFFRPDIDESVEYIIECTLHETQCIAYNDIITTKYYTNYYNLSGCASNDLCTTEYLLSRLRNSNVSVSCTDAFPQNSLTPSFFQKCIFQHDEIKSKPFRDLCLPDEDVCLSEHIQVEDAGRHIKEEYLQRCGRSRQCDLFIAISHPNKTIVMNTTCCQTQYCSPPTPNVSWVPGVANGLTCGSCYSANSSECHSNDTMFCTGIMDRCVTYTATKRSGNGTQTEILIGCGTKDACAYGWSFIGNKIQNIEVNITCTGRGNFVHNNIFIVILFPAIFSIFWVLDASGAHLFSVLL